MFFIKRYQRIKSMRMILGGSRSMHGRDGSWIQILSRNTWKEESVNWWWWSSGCWRRIGLTVDANVSEKHTVSIFRAEVAMLGSGRIYTELEAEGVGQSAFPSSSPFKSLHFPALPLKLWRWRQYVSPKRWYRRAYTVPIPRRSSSSISPPWKPQIPQSVSCLPLTLSFSVVMKAKLAHNLNWLACNRKTWDMCAFINQQSSSRARDPVMKSYRLQVRT
jgi:hypothetical protein